MSSLQELKCYLNPHNRDVHTFGPQIRSLNADTPTIHPEAVIIGDTTTLKGDVRFGNAFVMDGCNLRGDESTILVSDGCGIQENCHIHLAIGNDQGAYLGPYAQLTHNVIVHGAHVHDYAFVGIGAKIGDYAEVGEPGNKDPAIVGQGANVTQGAKLASGKIYVGQVGRGVTKEDAADTVDSPFRGKVESGAKITKREFILGNPEKGVKPYAAKQRTRADAMLCAEIQTHGHIYSASPLLQVMDIDLLHAKTLFATASLGGTAPEDARLIHSGIAFLMGKPDTRVDEKVQAVWKEDLEQALIGISGALSEMAKSGNIIKANMPLPGYPQRVVVFSPEHLTLIAGRIERFSEVAKRLEQQKNAYESAQTAPPQDIVPGGVTALYSRTEQVQIG